MKRGIDWLPAFLLLICGPFMLVVQMQLPPPVRWQCTRRLIGAADLGSPWTDIGFTALFFFYVGAIVLADLRAERKRREHLRALRGEESGD